MTTTNEVKKEPVLGRSPSTVFRSFMVMNTMPSTKKMEKSPSQAVFNMKRNNNNLVCREDWFTLKKFQIK